MADTLLDARDALVQRGAAPEPVARVLSHFRLHEERTRVCAHGFAEHRRVHRGSGSVLLIGCGYLLRAHDEAVDALEAAAALRGEPVSLFNGCCGLPLRLAGDARAFRRHAEYVARSLRGKTVVLVVDAGCARAVKRLYADAGVHIPARIETLVELAARTLSALSQVRRDDDKPIRWHDPCQLGRGLGIYDPPRAVLARALGRPPDEMEDRREHAPCSGAGGLLPVTMPEVARVIADTRLAAHRRAGGGRVVTGCASSLVAMRKRALALGVAVDDLVTWIARAAGVSPSTPSALE